MTGLRRITSLAMRLRSQCWNCVSISRNMTVILSTPGALLGAPSSAVGDALILSQTIGASRWVDEGDARCAEEVGGASAARELRCSVCLPFVANASQEWSIIRVRGYTHPTLVIYPSAGRFVAQDACILGRLGLMYYGKSVGCHLRMSCSVLISTWSRCTRPSASRLYTGFTSG